VSGLVLRGYQRELNDAVRAAWAGGMMRPAGVLPTGAGKTVAFADLIRVEHETGRVGRSLVVAHRAELINQAAKTLRALLPSRLRVGVVMAGQDQTGADVVVGSVQTLATERRRNRVRNVGLVVVDEAHHATAATYRKILGHYGCMPGTVAPSGLRAKAYGCSATMARGDGVGLGEVWEDVVYKRSIAQSIRDGDLVEPRGIRVDVEDLRLDKVRRSRGDFQDGALGEAMADSMAPQRIVEAWQRHASDRPTVLFAPTVEFAQIMVEAFVAAGVVADIVHGAQTPVERAASWQGVDSGKTRVLCNCMVATEGTDKPPWSCVIISRPTTNSSLYVQMVGRGMRPHPGKTDLLVLDVAGASRRNALTVQVDLIGTEDVAQQVDGDELDILKALEGDAVESGDEDSDFGCVYRDGTLVTEEFDLFHGSRLVWHQTHAGLWFLPAGNRYLVIAPAPAGYAVSAVESFVGGRAEWVASDAPDLSLAMGLAEAAVTEAEAEVAQRDAKHRSRTPLRPEARSFARQFGYTPKTIGQMRDVQVVHHASSRLDGPWLAYQQQTT
jgi:superfamily II DNA or RNA helicase